MDDQKLLKMTCRGVKNLKRIDQYREAAETLCIFAEMAGATRFNAPTLWKAFVVAKR